MVLFGGVKILGYCSRDLYRLAFQHDLALGTLLVILGAVMIFPTAPVISVLCTMFGILLLADALLKMQVAIDSKILGIKKMVDDPLWCHADRDSGLSADAAPFRKRSNNLGSFWTIIADGRSSEPDYPLNCGQNDSSSAAQSGGHRLHLTYCKCHIFLCGEGPGFRDLPQNHCPELPGGGCRTD